MKKTLLTIIAALLLGGVVNAQNHWGDDPNSHAQPSNTPIVASIQIGGENVTPTADYRLGAFIDGNLWGIAAPHTDGKFWIQVFYETAGAEISFKLYDGTNEYTTCAVVEPTTMTAVTTSEVGAVVTLNFTNAAEQTVELAAGYNWWSTNLDVTLDELKAALVAAMPSTTFIRITAQNGSYATYNGTNWRGTLSGWDITKFYIIQTNESCELTLTAQPVNPAERPITIVPNYNWIAFPLSEPTAVSTAFTGYTATNNDRVTAQDGKYATYNGNTHSWRGQLTTLQPGKGYIFSSQATGNQTLIFQSSAE